MHSCPSIRHAARHLEGERGETKMQDTDPARPFSSADSRLQLTYGWVVAMASVAGKVGY